MKKIYSILAALMIISTAASAQSLGSILGALGGSSSSSSSTTTSSSSVGDILGSLSKVIYSAAGNTTAVNIVGNWNYTGAAITLGGDDLLSNVASTAVTGTAEAKVNQYLAKVGVKEGTFKFVFNEDKTFQVTAFGIPVSGTWQTMDDATRIQLQFGKVMKFLNMTGTLKKTGPNSCQILFQGNKFLTFIKNIMSYVSKQNSTVAAISSLAGNYDEMKIGFNLTKQ